MALIDKLIKFTPKTKAVADEINSNFETLRLSNNEHEEFLNKIQENFNDYKLNELCEINCEDEILELNDTTYNFKVYGNSSISEFRGISNGFVFIEFKDTRLVVNSNKLKLQNNVDRITKTGDIGIYLFENGVVKEVNYFTSKEEKTNSLPTQTIIDAPKDKNGRSDFLKKVEFSKNIIPAMDSYENEDCIISSSSYYDGNYVPWRAFRHHNNDGYCWLTTNGITTGWLKVEFRNKEPKVAGFSITSRNSSDANGCAPCDFVIEGSNDDIHWTLLGDYTNNLNWLVNEKRYFALTYFDNFKYYRLTVNKVSGAGTYAGIGCFELYENNNGFMPMVAKVNLSTEKPLLVNAGIGKSTIGKINQLSIISQEQTIENLFNNSLMYAGYIKNEDNRFENFVTSACPVYSYGLQRHSNKNSIPIMISQTTSKDFSFGYMASASSSYNASYYPHLAFNGVLSNKWMANTVGGNQWLQIDFPNYRKAARFTIISSFDDAGGSIINAFVKGFNGEEWVVLKEILNEPAWAVNEVRHYDADVIESCNKFKLEIIDIQNPAVRAQVTEFQIYEVADCFVIPENRFYSYNIEKQEYEEKEIIYIGRIKTQNNFVSDVHSFAIDNKYISEETSITTTNLYSFFHDIGLDYKNLKVSVWIKDKVNGFVLPWHVDSNVDYSGEANNYGYMVDECQFNIRTVGKLMDYRDANNVQRTIYANVSVVVQIERNF